MRADTPLPYFNQDTGRQSGKPGIQAQTALSVGGERSEYQQEQQSFLQAASEIPPRPELVRQFIQQLGRWYDALSESSGGLSGGSFMLYPHEGGYAVQQRDQILDINTPTIWIVGGLGIKDFDGNGESPDWPSIDRRKIEQRELGVDFYCYKLEAGFVDPFNNRPMTYLKIGMLDTPYDSYRRYQLYIGVSYADVAEKTSEAVTYFEPKQIKKDTSEPERIQVTHHYRGSRLYDKPILLSGDVDAHAKELMDYADSLIQGSTPSTPPGRRATGEQQVVRPALPAPRRRPGR